MKLSRNYLFELIDYSNFYDLYPGYSSKAINGKDYYFNTKKQAIQWVDIVKDIFVASEGYLKAKTETSRFGDAIKDLFKKNLINKEQKKVLEALHEFRSDADGAGHAGNSVTPTEETALWFLDTLVAQLRMIDKKIKP